jgi:hypothetical protein
MLPAIVLILFFQGALGAVSLVLNQKDDQKRLAATFIAIGLGILPAWQTIEVWQRATAPTSYMEHVLRPRY